MPSPPSNHRDRVARPRSDVIDEVDGLPSSHTHPEPQPARKVTTDPGRSAALPFAAPSTIAAESAVAVMSAVVLLTACTAVLRVYAGHPHQFHIVAGLLVLVALECLVMTAAHSIGRRRQ